jgi:hypothetical protein
MEMNKMETMELLKEEKEVNTTSKEVNRDIELVGYRVDYQGNLIILGNWAKARVLKETPKLLVIKVKDMGDYNSVFTIKKRDYIVKEVVK